MINRVLLYKTKSFLDLSHLALVDAPLKTTSSLNVEIPAISNIFPVDAADNLPCASTVIFATV